MSPVLDTRPRILGMTRWPFAIVFGLSTVVAVVLLIVTMTSVRGAARVESALTTRRPAPPEEAPSKPRVAGVVRVGDSPTRATIEARRGSWYDMPVLGVASETAVAGDDGAFRFEAFPAGTWQLTATTPDGRRGFRAFSIGSGDAVELVVQIADGPHRLVGRVVRHGDFHGLVALTPLGSPLRSGGRPSLEGGMLVETDAHGNFAFDRVRAGRFHVRAYHPRLETFLDADVDVPIEKPVELVASNDLGRWLRGRVTRRDGTPVEGASVAIEAPDLTPAGVTSADGRFDFLYFRDSGDSILVRPPAGAALASARIPLPRGDAAFNAVLGPAEPEHAPAPSRASAGASPRRAPIASSVDRFEQLRFGAFSVPLDADLVRLRAVSLDATGLFMARADSRASDAAVRRALVRLPDDVLLVSVGGLSESGAWSGTVVVHQDLADGTRVSAARELDDASAAVVPIVAGCVRVSVEHTAIRARGDPRPVPTFVDGPRSIATRFVPTTVRVPNVLDVIVVDGAHAPMAGVRCVATPAQVDPAGGRKVADPETVTAADGVARLVAGPGVLVRLVPPPPFAPEAFAGRTGPGLVPITLVRGVPRTIRVRGPDTKPVAGATVRLLWLPTGGLFVDHAEGLGLPSFVTDASGAVTIPRTDPNRMYLVDVQPRPDSGLARAFAESWRADGDVIDLKQP